LTRLVDCELFLCALVVLAERDTALVEVPQLFIAVTNHAFKAHQEALKRQDIVSGVCIGRALDKTHPSCLRGSHLN